MATFKVLLTDAEIHPPSAHDRAILEAAGAELICRERPPDEEIIALAGEAAALMVAATAIPEAVIAHLAQCRIIAKIGTGHDNIDSQAAGRAGIPVTNVPEFCTAEVADHAMALLLDCAHKVGRSNRDVRSGRWNPADTFPLVRLEGKRLGLVGYGKIGRAVATRAAAFGLHVGVFDPALPDDEKVDRYASLHDLLREADIVSLHLPLTADTRGLLGEKELALMKKSAILINCARGAIVDESALFRALSSGALAAAGLDTLEEEPPAPDNPLLQLDNAVITPHSAAFSEEAIVFLRTSACEEVARALRGEPLKHVVNREWLP